MIKIATKNPIYLCFKLLGISLVVREMRRVGSKTNGKLIEMDRSKTELPTQS
jgi:hypothetical protein